MKSLPLIPFLAVGLAAQQAQQQPDVKIPRAPSVGVEKSFEPLPMKNGVPAATDLVVPTEQSQRPLPAADQAVVDAVKGSIAQQFADPNFVAFDTSADGTFWAVGRNYKAAFGADGWRFIGQPAPTAPGLQPIEMRLTNASVGGSALALAAPQLVRDERHVEYRYGSVVEELDIAGRGVEQTFTFTSLPQRGELVLQVAANTALEGTNTADGVTFRGEFDEVTYSQAIAIDANGVQVAAPTALVDGKLEIRVPADFVAHAALPLRVDPWLSAVQIYSSTNDVGDPDIAWDETGQVWAVCFMRYFGGADWDCYVQRCSQGNPMTLVGGLTTIDGSSISWQRPRIANLGVYSEFMVVCQTSDSTTPWKIQGRIMGNSGVIVTPQFLIHSSGVDELHPDIGGDSYAPPTYFTVVWEHAFSATDHDIYARQIDASGNLRGTSPIFVQTNTTNQSWPSISKSDGGGPSTTQRYGIVYQQTFGAGDEDTYGAMLTWDGNFVTVGGNNTFAVNGSGYNDVFPQVSSPTLADNNGFRYLLAVAERNNFGNGDIQATCFDFNGAFRASDDVNLLELSLIRQPWTQYRPSVDSDGYRFVVGYHEVYNNNPTVNDLDTRVTTLALNSSGLLFAEEAGVALGFSGNREFNMQVASRYAGTGSYSLNFNTCNDRDGIPSGGFAIDAYAYDAAPQGSFVTRTTACGTLGISATGSPVPNGLISLALTFNPNIQGFLLGSAVSVPIGPCPACTLGVDGFFAFGQVYNIAVPNSGAMVGIQFSAQGLVLQPSGAPCLNQLQFSDTVDVTIG